jgi:hypothetical protein
VNGTDQVLLHANRVNLLTEETKLIKKCTQTMTHRNKVGLQLHAKQTCPDLVTRMEDIVIIHRQLINLIKVC